MGRHPAQVRHLVLRGARRAAQAPRRVGRVPARRDDVVADHVRRDASGVLRPQGATRRHGRRSRRGVALLPDVPALLRPDVLGGAGQGSRLRLCPCLQRLDGRGVVRRFRWAAHPAVHRAAVGRRARRCRGAPQRGAGRDRGRVLGDPRQARAAHAALGILGAVLPGVRRDRDAGVHAHRIVVADAGHVTRRTGRGAGDAQLRQRDVVDDRLPVLGRAGAQPAAANSRTARGRSAGSPTSSNAPTTCGSNTGRGVACRA